MSVLFRKKKDPAEYCREWKSQLRKETRQIEREIRSIEREEAKVKAQIKAAAKRGDTASAKILARELVQSRHAKVGILLKLRTHCPLCTQEDAWERLFTARAQLNSVCMQLQSQLATIRMAGAMQASAQVMKSMNELVRLPQLHATMMAMSREMEKAGLLEEMIADTLEMDDESLDEQADEEVEKVFLEIASSIMDKAAPVTQQPLPETEPVPVQQTAEEDELAARLGALRG